MELKNRTILITGGTSGIGKELVALLAPINKKIIVVATNPVKLDEIKNNYKNVVTYQCSLAKKMEVEETIEAILEEHPDLSVVFNNAGIQKTPMFHEKEFSFDSIDTEVTVNLTAQIWISALTLGHFLNLEAPAAYINVTSGLGLYPKKNSAVYCATKAGLLNFTRSFRYQLESTPIRAYAAIMPLVDTPMTEGRGKGKITAKEAASQIIKGVEKDKDDIYVGKTKLMPMMSRISPTFMASIMKGV
ncbi:SDR family oxidoreductase [Marinimicrobium agarilyticum]|uniref:SDR family oxidoreductase n=1 Tax=Marinimicrobium agarilyticum TaxID=306546 RepID=UPI0004176E88|nr:SDR family NAD(P)-dependent oxidoreductase [Marinimicrobium agarilyticum]